jgi:nitroreductase
MGAEEAAAQLTVDELLTTTRAVRKRLDLSRPVPRELLLECLEIGLQAPTGSNRQGWQFVFVSDPEKKRAITEYYARTWRAYSQQPAPRHAEGDVRAESLPRVASSAQYLAEHLHEAPWLMIPCHRGRLPENAPVFMQAGFWGSILPAFWSFMLAARARGLGTAWTTFHLAYERECAEILGIPYEKYTQAGLTPIAYTKGGDFKPATRIPLESVVHFETWGNRGGLEPASA